jgi:hypothetical protein
MVAMRMRLIEGNIAAAKEILQSAPAINQEMQDAQTALLALFPE